MGDSLSHLDDLLQHKMPQSRQNVPRQVARNISQRIQTNLLARLCTCSELVVGGRDLLKIS